MNGESEKQRDPGQKEKPLLIDDFLSQEAKKEPANPGELTEVAKGEGESEKELVDDFLLKEDKEKSVESGKLEGVSEEAREGTPEEGQVSGGDKRELEKVLKTIGGKKEKVETPENVVLSSKSGGKVLISEKTVLDTGKGGTIRTTGGYILTPSARDLLEELKIKIVDVQSVPGEDEDEKAAGVSVVALGSDHRGFELKKELRSHLIKNGVQVIDVGTDSPETCDFPDFAKKVADKIINEQAQRGVMIDGVGVGSAMAANKVKGIRAAVCNDTASAASSRAHNDANVLTMGSTIITASQAKEILDTWLKTPYEGGRHQKRVDKITELEQGSV
ncbi:ribose 5-phosphate isomerase B [bacterium]|nr:ribose 5-phosphate isomerase B [bacterium]